MKKRADEQYAGWKGKPSDFTSLSDEELKARREALPKYKNDMTPEQITEGDALYAEQHKRFKVTVEEYNKAATEKTGLKHGDEVEYPAQGLGGLGAETYRGKVVYDKNGYLSVKTNVPDGSGKKIHGINIGWKKVVEGKQPPSISGGMQPSKGITSIKSAEFVNIQEKQVPFKLSDAILGIAKKYAGIYGEKYNPKGTVGVMFTNDGTILTNALNDVYTNAHEITHYINRQKGIITKITKPIGTSSNGNPIYNSATLKERRELTQVYTQYYLGGKKDHKLSKRATEGFATFVTHMVFYPKRTQKEFPTLYNKFLTPNGKYYQKNLVDFIRDSRKVIEDYQKLSSTEKISSRVTEQSKEVSKPFFRPMATATDEIFDDIHFLEKTAKDVGLHFKKDDPSIYLRMYRNMHLIIQHNIGNISYLTRAISGGNSYLAMDENGEFNKLYDFNWKTLIDKTENHVEFGAWLVARREHFSYLKLDELKIEIDEAKDNLATLRAQYEEGEITKTEYKQALGEVKSLEKKYDTLKSVLAKDNIDRKVATDSYNEHKEKYVEHAEMFDKLEKADLDLLHNPLVQLVDDKSYNEFSSNIGYASFKRDFYNEILGEEKIGALTMRVGKTSVSSLMPRTGSQLDIINPLYSGIVNHAEIVKKAQKQVVYNKLLKISDSYPGILKRLPLDRSYDTRTGKTTYPQDKDKNIIMVRENYKRVPLLVDRQFKGLIDEVLTPQNVKLLEKILAGGARLFTQFTTGWYPPFAITNMAIDQVSATSNSWTKYKPVLSAIGELKKALVNRDAIENKYALEYLLLGGERQAFISFQDMEPTEALQFIKNEHSVLKSFINLLNNAGDIVSTPVRASEIMTRMVEYIRARKEGYHQLAALELAGRVSVPFHHRGRMGGDNIARAWRRSIPYLGAGIQVVGQTGRALNNQKTRNRALFVGAVLTTAMVSSMLYIMKKATQEQKDLYKNIDPDELGMYVFYPHPNGKDLMKYRVPQELAIGGTMASMAISDLAFDANYTWHDYMNGALNFLPNQINPSDVGRMIVSWIPQIVAPAIQVAFNKRIYPHIGDLEPFYMRGKPPEEKVFETTSRMAKLVGKTFNLSPIKVDYLVNGSIGRGVKFIKGGQISNPFIRHMYFNTCRNLLFFYDERDKIYGEYSYAKKNRQNYTQEQDQELTNKYNQMKQIDKYLDIYRDLVVLVNKIKDEKGKQEQLDKELGKIRSDILNAIDTYRKPSKEQSKIEINENEPEDTNKTKRLVK
ncbi:MAG: LPD38 domain-containing protein [Candidatus Marinimicrobia bacterium]|nr:LPD38 domain-containing protein [Candidatus Neomarinimicrobiota bacterium]